MATLFITGATGNIGREILAMLAEHHSIRALAYQKEGIHHHRIEWVHGDLRHSETYWKALKGCDYLIHLAADVSTTSMELHRTNVKATRELVLNAREQGCKKIIIFSSASVTQKYLTPYARSKKEMEEELKSLNIPIMVLRPTLVYSKGAHVLKGMERYLHLPLPFIPLLNGGKANLRPIPASDIGNALLAILTNKKFPSVYTTYDLASETDFTYRQMVELLAKQNGITKPIMGIPHRVLGEIYSCGNALGWKMPLRFIQFAALGESYHVDPRPFIEKYGVHFTDPKKGIRESLAEKE